jgi:erythromycin esterase-like protein
MLLRIVLPFALVLPALGQGKPPVTDWIAAHAIPLTTVEARHGFDDLQPLKKVVGDARIVELGEATHGSREFFQLKHRMLDLREAPKSGAVADWFKAPHKTRCIGAVYPEDSPFAYLADFPAPEAFDVVLFIANSTFADKNPGW